MNNCSTAGTHSPIDSIGEEGKTNKKKEIAAPISLDSDDDDDN